jgi:O-antigen/teichoic acid export membrane protein
VGADEDAIRDQIRGSTLLLIGRILGLAMNVVVQILIVRYLSKTDYGAFAYALSIVVVAESFAILGLDRAITRFVPIYQERAEYGKMAGTILLVAGTVLSLGVTLILAVQGLRGFLGHSVIDSREAAALLSILIVLAPIQALDTSLMGLFAVLGRPREIFLRTYVLAPGLRIAVVVLVLLSGGGTSQLAAGYVVAAAVGFAVYSIVLVQTLHAQNVLRQLTAARLVVPAREIFALTLPLLTTDLVWVLLLSSDAILLGHFRGTDAVANFRVLQPAAELNLIVLSSFSLLFIPLAARLFARRNTAAMNELYWRTALFVALVTFPVFALTFTLSNPLIQLLYGSRYSASATYLAILALGYYFQAALGFNGTTLMVTGRVGIVSVLNVAAIVINIILNLVLIPRYGALGASIGTSASLVIHNLLKQAGLALATRTPFVDRRYIKPYATIAAAAGALLVVRQELGGSDLLRLTACLLVSSAVLLANRNFLRVGQTFPELTRVPGLRLLFRA